MEATKEQLKTCSKCKLVKCLHEFQKDKNRIDNLSSTCKTCAHEVYQENKGRCKEYYKINREKRLNYQKEYYNENREQRLEYQRQYNDCNKEKIADYVRKKYKNNEQHRVACNIRSGLNHAIRCDSASVRHAIGISYNTFIEWIAFQFTDDMTMENYGSLWHFDHVLPLSAFNLLNEDEFKKATCWINIRPMLAVKNKEKAAKINLWLYVCQEIKANYFTKNILNKNGDGDTQIDNKTSNT